MLKISIVIIALALIYLLFRRRKRVEGFKILGSLGKQSDLYYSCINRCEKSDPGDQLTPSRGSQSCLARCDDILTDITRRGGPAYPDDNESIKVKILGISDNSYRVCGDGPSAEKCRSDYTTAREIFSRCKQDCKYGGDGRCIELCSKSLSANMSLGWSGDKSNM